MQKWLSAWTFSNVHISLSAFFYALASALILGEYPPFSILLIVFSGTLVAYLFHRMYPIWANHKIAAGNAILNWTNTNKQVLNVLFATAVVISLLSFIRLTYNIQVLLVLLAAINVFYSIPIFKKNKVKVALRDWPFTKIFLIAFTWASVCATLPSKAIGSIEPSIASGLFFEKFFFILAITIPFDIKDIESDVWNKVKTIPQKFGNNSAIVIALFCLIVSLFFFLTFVESSLAQKIAYLIFYAFSATLIYKSRNVQSDQFYLFSLDGLMILLFALLLLVS